MPLIWCSISAHGFGHAAQVIPVLNELGRQIPDLHVVLRTALPSWFFQDRLHVVWEMSASEQDIGCAQQGPLYIDVSKTWSAYAAFHRDWKNRVTAEADAIRSRSPHLVLSDISYLAIEAGANANVPSIGLSSICWDQVLDHFQTTTSIHSGSIRQEIQDAYRQADLMIRVSPAIDMPAFRRIIDVGPIVARLQPDPDGIRRAVGVSPDERLVAVAFGGIPLTSLPWEHIETMTGYWFIVPGPVPPQARRILSSDTLPFRFQTIMASCDLLFTKPGYGTIVEAVLSGTPVVYVRRHNFADEDSLIAYLHHYGRGIELSADDFLNGRWEPTMETILSMALPMNPPPPATGAAEAARLLKRHMKMGS